MPKPNTIFIEGLCGLESFTMPFECSLDFVKSKEQIFNHLINDMVARTIRMFKYENYPGTFSPWAFERGLQSQGFMIVWKGKPNNGKSKEGVYALRGVGLGGVLDDRYLPTRAVGANPYLNITINDELDGDNVVWCWNDSRFMGLNGINSLYAGLLADAFITLRLKLVLHRAPAFLVASNEDDKNDAMDFLYKLDKGELGVIGSKSSLENILGGEGFSTKPNLGDGTNTIKEIIEGIQYLTAQWNIKIGLNDNYNMKREALNSSETSANEDTLYTLIEDMYEQRKEAIKEINSKFGTNINVMLAGEWKRVFEKRKLADEAEKKAVEEMGKDETDPEPKPEEPKPEDVKEEKEDD